MNVEYFDGTYTLSYYSPGDVFELAPDLRVRIISDFVFLTYGGQCIVVESEASYFSHNNTIHYITSHGKIGTIALKYRVWRRTGKKNDTLFELEW